MLFNALLLSIPCHFTIDGREQIQNAKENPIQAQSKSNIENLLDLEVGSTEIPSPTVPNHPSSILEDLGSLSISSSPVVGPPVSKSPPLAASSPVSAPASNMNDLLGIFEAPGQNGGNAWESGQNNAGTAQGKNKTNEDILGLF
jgi:hypothetical protein